MNITYPEVPFEILTILGAVLGVAIPTAILIAVLVQVIKYRLPVPESMMLFHTMVDEIKFLQKQGAEHDAALRRHGLISGNKIKVVK